MTRSMLITIAVLAALATAGAAGAAVNHVLGKGGTVYQFDAQCHRTSFVQPGISTKEGLNVVAQQTRCLVRRADPFARCVKKLGPAPTVTAKFDHGAGKPADWSGVDALQAYVAAVGACSKAHY